MPFELNLAPPPQPVSFVPDPRAQLPRSAEIVVVGAGLLGASAAYRLSRVGAHPLVIDANAPASGASGRNAGMALQGLGGHFERVTRLVQAAGGRSILDYTCRSLELLAELDDALPGGIEFERCGSLDLFLDDAQVLHGRRMGDAQRAEGLVVEMIDVRQLAELEPALDVAPLRGARRTPSDATLNPFKLVYGMLSAAVDLGARVVTGVRVERLVERHGRIVGVETSHGTVEADAVLLATNAWSPMLAPSVGGNLTPIREHVCVTEPVPRTMRHGFETNRCNEYWRQMRSGEVVTGGFTVADDGMGIGTYSMAVHPAVPPRLGELLGRLFPSLADVRVVRCWAGLLDFASLEIPMAGRLPDGSGRPVEGAYLACGLTGHGMPYAPILGLLLSELVLHGEARTLSLAPFDPSRYAGTRHAPTWLEPFGVPAGTPLSPAGSASSPTTR